MAWICQNPELVGREMTRSVISVHHRRIDGSEADDIRGYGGIGRRARFRFFRHTAELVLAELMELADMQDLGSCAERRVGSSPTFRSIYKGFL